MRNKRDQSDDVQRAIDKCKHCQRILANPKFSNDPLIVYQKIHVKHHEQNEEIDYSRFN